MRLGDGLSFQSGRVFNRIWHWGGRESSPNFECFERLGGELEKKRKERKIPTEKKKRSDALNGQNNGSGDRLRSLPGEA